MAGMTLEQFLGHRTRESSGEKTNRLSGWRKEENARRNENGDLENNVVVWLHCRQLFRSFCQHNWPNLVEIKNGPDAGKTKLWGGQCICIEDESVIRRQYHRNRETGERTSPPVICPFCRLNEHVRGLVVSGKLKWTDVLFKYEAGPDKKILHAGGIYNAFGKKTLTPEETEELKAAKIYRTEAYKESAVAAWKYLCFVVDNADPSKGVQISVESDSIGDAMKRKLAEEIEGRGDEGNPMLHPYALKFKYFKDEPDFRKKYSVVPMPKIELTDEIRNLIFNTEPPDVGYVLTPWNMKSLRASMEEHCLYELDWDWIFGPVEARCNEKGFYVPPGETKAAEPPKETPKEEKVEEPKSAPKSESKPAPSPNAAPAKSRRAPVPEPTPEPAEGSEPCVKCGYMMGPEDLQCAGCGQQYAPVSEDSDVPF